MTDPNAAEPAGSDSARPPWSTLFTLGFSFVAVGMTVSVALVNANTPPSIIMVAATVIFSATSELAYITVRDGGGSQLAAIASGWLVASRFGLLTTTLGTKMGGSRKGRAAAALTSVDPNVAIAVAEQTPRRVRAAFWWTTASLLVGFMIGSLIGIVVGNVVADIRTWGIDAIFPAALLAIIASSLRRRDGLSAAIIGAAVCLALTPFVPGGVPILASVVGAVIAARAFAAPDAPGGDPDLEPGVVP